MFIAKSLVRTACTIKQSVPSLDGVVYSISTGCIVDLPQPKSNLRHLVAIVERDIRRAGGHCCEGVAVQVVGKSLSCRTQWRRNSMNWSSKGGRIRRRNGRAESRDFSSRAANTSSKHILQSVLVDAKIWACVRYIRRARCEINTALRLLPHC